MKNLLKVLTDYPAEIAAGDVNAAGIIAKLTVMETDHGVKKQARDNDKIRLAGSQSTYEGSARTKYTAFSDIVDLMAGAVGKNTPLGQHILNQRKNLTGSTPHHAGSSSSISSSSSSSSGSGGSSSSSSSSSGQPGSSSSSS